MPEMINGKPVNEAKWNKAKELAAEEGHGSDYAYIMGIYKRMTGMKALLFIGDLFKGRKAVAIGTVKDVPGTPYKRVRMATGWQHVKVAPNGDLIDSSGAVIGNYSGTGRATMVSTASTKRQGRGRPTGTVKTQPAPAGTPAKGRGRPRKVPVVTAPVQVKAPAKKTNINKNKTVTKPQATTTPAPAAPDIPADIDWTYGEGDSGLPVADTTTVVDTAATVQAVSTPDAPKKEKKIKDKPDKDVYKVGDRVLRKNKSGTMYWSVKQADGTWAYDGIATPAQIQAWKLGERRRKMAEKQRAEHEKIMAEREKNKNKTEVVGVSADPDWNVDGTPTAYGLAKMGTKEKLYWTEASERARKLSDQCGVLCLDKEAEDYVADKLDTVFKAATIDKKTMETVKADIPLDFDGKFADDPVFMQDTLANLKTYLSAVKANESGYLQMIYDKIIAEGYPHGPSVRTTAEDKYADLIRSVETWISKIENQDKDRIALATLRDFDEQVAAVREVGKVPTLAIRAVFGKDIDDLMNSKSIRESYGYDAKPAWEGMFTPGAGETPNKVIELLHSVGFDDRLIADYMINDRYSNDEAMNRKLVGLLTTILSPDVGTTAVADWFATPYFDAQGNLEHRFHETFNIHKYSANPSVYGVQNRYKRREPPAGLTIGSFLDKSAEARTKYKALSELLSNTIKLTGKIPAPDNVFKPQSSVVDGFILKHPDGMTNGVMADHIKKFRKSVKKDSVEGDTNITILDNIATAMSGDLKDESFNILPQVLERMYSEKHKGLSENMRSYVTIPEKRTIINEFKSIGGYYAYNSSSPYAPEAIDWSMPAERNKHIGRAGLKSKQYRVHHSLKGMVEYSNMTRDSGRGGLKKSDSFREVLGENAALKSAIKASWSDLTVIPTVASWRGYGSNKAIGVTTHTEASLAVAIGLNWQLRKLTKKSGMIPNWKWFEGTKPFEPKNKFSVVVEPKIDDVTVTSRRRYGGSRQYTYSGRGGGSMKESEYRDMLQNAKNEVLAVELGLSEVKKTDPNSRAPAPKIVLKTNNKSADEWQKDIEADWTHSSAQWHAAPFKVNHVFDVLYHDYYDSYKAREDKLIQRDGTANIKTLYHGTDFQGGAGIIKNGWGINRQCKAGNMMSADSEFKGNYNTGFYGADSSSKSAQYASDGFRGSGGSGVMFKMRVVQGNVNPPSIPWSNACEARKPDGSFTYETIYGQKGVSADKSKPHNRHGYKVLQHDEWYVRGKDGVIPTQWIDVSPR